MALPIRKPMMSFAVNVSVAQSVNQIYQAQSSHSKAYPAPLGVQNTYMELEPETVFSGGATSCLVIRTLGGPVQFYGTTSKGKELEFTVTSILVLDEPLELFRLYHEGEESIQMWLNYSVYGIAVTGDGGVKSVNGQLPDINGNVTVDTGVMTINHQEPDADGNIDISTDEGQV